MDVAWKWCSPDGDDTTGVGTHANPYETAAKAMTEATGGTGIYIRSGTYDMGATYLNTNRNITGTGYTDFTNTNSSYWFLCAGNRILKHLYCKRSTPGSYVFFMSFLSTYLFDSCYVDNFDGITFVNTSELDVTFKNIVAVLDETSPTSYVGTHKNPTTVYDTCWISAANPSRDFSYEYVGVNPSSFTIKHCKIDSDAPGLISILNDLDELVIKDN